jgi:hypothetical protein
MYKNRCFFRPSDEFEIWKFGIPEIQDTFVQLKFGKFRPEKKHFYRIRSAAVPGRGNRDIFGHFFRNVTNLQKKVKCKKTQKCKTSRKHLKFWVFLSKIGLWRFVEALKSVENDTENPRAHSAHFFSAREAFSGFFRLST